jgi:hypothetical protein
MPARTRRVLATLTLGVLATACIFDPVAPEIQIDTLDAALDEVALPALDSAAAVFSGSAIVQLTITTPKGKETCRIDITTTLLGC